MTITRFSFPTTIHFGPGARSLVAEHLKQQGCKRPLIVTDKGLGTLPILHDFAESLDGLDVKVYAGVFGNPVKIVRLICSTQASSGTRVPGVLLAAGIGALGVGTARRSALVT